jgi:hypothetical protein
MLRSLGRCCLGKQGGSAKWLVFVEMGATSTASGRLEVNLFLTEKRGGKSHFGIILVSAVSGI